MAGEDLPSFHGIIGRSAAMQALFAEVAHFASVDVPILIRGESGTGKELVAKAIQRLSERRARPFETLNCADLTRDLLRSELFGHERGAFTGAVRQTAGLVTRLHGGTLFMDEIGELPPDAQGMLLRFLQEGEGRPVGAVQSITVDVRVIAATHQDLEAGVERGTVREDFYYRLQVRHLQETPLILVGPTWPALIEWARQAMLAFDPPLADARDLAIPRCVASADEALAIIQAHHAMWLSAQPTGTPSPPSSRTRATPGASSRRPSRTASR